MPQTNNKNFTTGLKRNDYMIKVYEILLPDKKNNLIILKPDRLWTPIYNITKNPDNR